MYTEGYMHVLKFQIMDELKDIVKVVYMQNAMEQKNEVK